MIRFFAEGGGTPPPTRNNFGDTMSDGMAGPLALLIIVLLAIATALLIRNMNARLRRLPERFPDQPGPARRSAAPSVPPADPAESGSAAPTAAAVDPSGHGAPTGPATAAGG
jgi:hypothetical protein